MKNIVNKIFNSLARLFYPGFNVDTYSKRTILAMIFYQKILRINGSVPWPVHFTSKVKAPKKIARGTKAPGFSPGCYLDGRNGIVIGENVWIGPYVSIISMDHNLTNYHQYKVEEPIVIGKDSLLTTHCIILPGVTLGEHTVVAAGSVVTKSFPEGDQVLAGNPAKVIKKLDRYLSKD
jgi:Acetyltransferase (isoleucine patch superfamily)